MQPVLRGTGMAPYVVTKDDALWLARAVEAEGPPQPQIAAILINGFTWARARKNYRGTLTSWIRAYAQPVNPRWYPGGDLLREHAKKFPGEAAKQAALAQKRLQHSARTTFTPSTQAAVTAALAGKVQLPTGATDYAVAHLDASKKGYKPLTVAQAGVNRLWARPGAESWTGYVADAAEAAAAAVASAASGSVLPWAIAAAAIGFFAWKMR